MAKEDESQMRDARRPGDDSQDQDAWQTRLTANPEGSTKCEQRYL